jgi:molecular chaperone DnaJ
MATKRCYYEILEIEKSASDKQIAAAYRRLAVKFHPDSNTGDVDAAERFKEIAEAYEILSDEQKKARYDRFGHAGVQAGMGEGGPGGFGDIFGDLFKGVFGDGGPRRGNALRCDVTITLEEAFTGCTKTVEFHRSQVCRNCSGSGARPGSKPAVCRQCNGRGQMAQNLGFVRVKTTCNACGGSGQVIVDACSECRGQGLVAVRVKLDVAIPGGVDTGMRIRLQGEGEPSQDGGPAGDCYCFITVKPHKIFRRDGKNLVLELPISFTQAALGAQVEVPTLTGRDKLDIPRGTQSASLFALRGRGMPDPRGGQKGDLLVQATIEVPTTLNEKQEKLLRELAELEHVHVTPQRKTWFEAIGEYFSFFRGAAAADAPKEEKKEKKKG